MISKCQVNTGDQLYVHWISYFNQLDPYRCSWYATKTVVLFATNIFGNTEFQGMLRTQNILKNVLDTLQKVSFLFCIAMRT